MSITVILWIIFGIALLLGTTICVIVRSQINAEKYWRDQYYNKINKIGGAEHDKDKKAENNEGQEA